MKSYEVIVYGATPGGIGAALAAARSGRRTLLLEPSPYVGGMLTSGLGITDIDWPEASGAIYQEFIRNVLRYYRERYGPDSEQASACNNGMFFEPSVAKQLLLEMLETERALDVKCRHELKSAVVEAARLTAIHVLSRADESRHAWSAAVFIDATYEGDLAAMAGVPYEIGRESRDVWNEEYAGKIYMNFNETKEVFPGSTGEGDDRIQAYNYRLCLTDVQTNKAAVKKPARYRRDDYTSLLPDVREQRVRSIRDVLNVLPLPNGKTDTNNHHYCMCSSDLPEENGGYPEGSPAVREAIAERHRDYIQGLLWFLQHDEELPDSFKQDARRWGYAADEFADSGHFPPQIYVREGRRICGEYVFTENDARLAPGLGRSPIHYDSVAVGAYSIDSHAARKREPAGKNAALEGFLGLYWLTEIYQVPFGVMVPRQLDGLLVPVAVSATHMGFGTIRMEPCWMQLGFAAGAAADLSIAQGSTLRALSVDSLQDVLLAHDQLITYFQDNDPLTEEGKAIQYFGAKGVFTEYDAHPDQPISVKAASQMLALSRNLPGGRTLPMLPASDGILPAGTDMGPRLPMNEPAPADYWRHNPNLTRRLFTRWLTAAKAHLCVEGAPAPSHPAPAAGGTVAMGEFCLHVYAILKELRSRALNAQKGGH